MLQNKQKVLNHNFSLENNKKYVFLRCIVNQNIENRKKIENFYNRSVCFYSCIRNLVNFNTSRNKTNAHASAWVVLICVGGRLAIPQIQVSYSTLFS